MILINLSYSKDNEEKYNYRNYNKNNDNFENSYKDNYLYNNTTRNNNKISLNEMKYERRNLNYGNTNLYREYNKENKYNMRKSKSKSFEIINDKNKKLKKGELNYLENYLNSLLKERSKLEKMLNEIPGHPRTLKDIKQRNNIKDKIGHNESEILVTQQQLKNLREN
jgi:hypothetical protein